MDPEPGKQDAGPVPPAGDAAAGPRRLLSEPDGYALLARHGIRVPAHRVAGSPEEAADIADAIGYPVVLKVVSPQVIHKSDVGGVVTGLPDRTAVLLAFRSVREKVRKAVPDAVITGMLVMEQLPKGLELLVGGITDPTFGKVITLGMGGITVELMPDVTMRILPVGNGEFFAMIRELRGRKLIEGFRGQPPLDSGALSSLLSVIARMFLDTDIAEFDINPVLLYESGYAVVDARIFVGPAGMSGRVQEAVPELSGDLLRPSSIAVIGASADPRKIGYAVMRNLLPFPGTVYPVNPHAPEILGRKAYPAVAAIPGALDWGVVVVPAPAVPGIITELGEKGVKLAIVVSSGFRETGEAGRRLEEQVFETARRYGIRVIGPNSLGIMLPHRNINTTFDPVAPQPGHIGFISQSGAIITTMVDWSIPERIGFSAVISVGNQRDLGFIEYLQYVASDPDTRAIVLYIEEIREGPAFLSVVGGITRKKPVIALKSGSSTIGKLAASSHTGSLAGSYEVYQAAFRQSGVIPAFTLKEAFEIGELLASEGYPEGNRAVVVTAAGGFAVLASDYAEQYGIDLINLPPPILDEVNAFLPAAWSHRNPMDIIGDGGAERYARIFDVLIRHQDDWDIAFVIGVPSAMLDAAHLGQEIARFSKHTRKMIVGCLLGGESLKQGITILRENGIPNYPDIEDAFRAVGRSMHIAHRCW